jgi:aryl-alcohol dehydrogenase-like predicted oxidoreductase
MTFGGSGFWGAVGKMQQDDVNAMVNRCLDAGINFFDTANVYSEGQSEEFLGRALGAKRKEVIVATKVCGRMGPGANSIGLSRVHILNEVHASLKRLNTDYIDLYQIHGMDPMTDMEIVLRTLDDLVRQGKVRYIGCSNLMAWQLMKYLGISQRKNLEAFVSLQALYTVANRDPEREIIPLLQDQKLGLLVWSPLAGGFLSGKYTRQSAGEQGARRTIFDFPVIDKERAYNIIDVMTKIAGARGVSVSPVALAWLLHQPAVTSVIIGAKKMDQLEDNLPAVKLALSADEMSELNSAGALPPEYPGWMQEFTKKTSGRVPPEK